VSPLRSRRAVRTAAVVVALAAAVPFSGRTPVHADSVVGGTACSSIGWTRIDGPEGSFSVIDGSAALNLVYVGSRDIDVPGRVTLFYGQPNNLTWNPVPQFAGIRVSDVALTPTRTTEVWASTLGTGADFDGLVLGRSGLNEFTPRGSLRTWFMRLAVTTSDLFAAVSKPGEVGVYRWDELSAVWQFVGGDTIPTDYFRQFEAGSNDRLWLGTDREGLWVSGDAGATWIRSRGGSETVWSLAVSPTEPNRVLVGLGPSESAAGSYPQGVRVSADGGQTWADGATPAAFPHSIAGARLVTALAFSRINSERAFAAAWDGGLYQSFDHGFTWAPMPQPDEQQGFFNSFFTLAPSGTLGCELLYAAGADGVWVHNLAAPPYSAFIPTAGRHGAFQ